MRDLLDLIDEALEERRWSARQASIEAVGSAHLISRMRRGQEPSVSRLRALCDVLGLEFYVGKPRRIPGTALDVGRLALALEAVTASFPEFERKLPMHDRAQLLAAVYALVDARDPSTSAAQVREVIAIAKRFGVADAVRD